MPALQSLLSPQVLTKVISQKAKVSDWLINLMGLGPGGKNEVYEGHGRTGAFHIFDHTRKVGLGRAPGTAAGRSAANPMGQVLFTYPRMHDSLSLPAEILHNLSKISDPAVRDKSGADMIARQTDYIGEKSANWRKAMLIGMLRDSLFYQVNGDDVIFSYTTGNRINFQMPAGNRLQLNMLGEGNIINQSWANLDTDIPDHLGRINRAFQILCGGKLGGAIITHQIFNLMRRNNVIQEEHGFNNSPYLRYEQLEMEQAPGNTMKNVLVVEFRSFPGCVFYVTDEVIDLGYDASESLQPIVPVNGAIFFGFDPANSAGVVQCYQGSEPIAEYDGAPETEKIGFAAWSVKRSNPTATELYTLDNALMVNHIPAAMAQPTLVF
jgi:hypothetical protein